MQTIDFRSIPLFASVSDDELSRLRSEGRLLHVQGGLTLYRQGEQVDSLYTLVEGRLALATERDGVRHVVMMPPTGTSFPLTSLAGGGRAMMSAATVSSCRLIVIPVHTIHDLTAANNTFAQAVISEMLAVSRTLVEVSHSRGLMSPSERLATWLWENLAPRSEVQIYALPVTQRVIAASLGMSIATLSREFAKLAESGVELARSEVRIRDPEALRRIAVG